MNSPKIPTSAQSSAEFSAELIPDPVVDRLSAGVTLLCFLAGAALLAATAVPWPLRLVAIVAWLAVGYRGRRQVRAKRLRIYANGDVHLQLAGGQWFDGEVAAGSLFLSRFAWLRVEGRVPYRGWFVASDAAPQEWRRLRVIARHFADI